MRRFVRGVVRAHSMRRLLLAFADRVGGIEQARSTPVEAFLALIKCPSFLHVTDRLVARLVCFANEDRVRIDGTVTGKVLFASYVAAAHPSHIFNLVTAPGLREAAEQSSLGMCEWLDGAMHAARGADSRTLIRLLETVGPVLMRYLRDFKRWRVVHERVMIAKAEETAHRIDGLLRVAPLRSQRAAVLQRDAKIIRERLERMRAESNSASTGLALRQGAHEQLGHDMMVRDVQPLEEYAVTGVLGTPAFWGQITGELSRAPPIKHGAQRVIREVCVNLRQLTAGMSEAGLSCIEGLLETGRRGQVDGLRRALQLVQRVHTLTSSEPFASPACDLSESAYLRWTPKLLVLSLRVLWERVNGLCLLEIQRRHTVLQSSLQGGGVEWERKRFEATVPPGGDPLRLTRLWLQDTMAILCIDPSFRGRSGPDSNGEEKRGLCVRESWVRIVSEGREKWKELPEVCRLDRRRLRTMQGVFASDALGKVVVDALRLVCVPRHADASVNAAGACGGRGADSITHVQLTLCLRVPQELNQPEADELEARVCVALQGGHRDLWAKMMSLVVPHLKGESIQRLSDNNSPAVDWLHVLWAGQVSVYGVPAPLHPRPFDRHCVERAKKLHPVVQLSMAVHAQAFRDILGF